MRLANRVRAFVLVAAVVPLLVLAVVARDSARRQTQETVARAQVGAAQQLAVSLGRALDDLERVLAAQVGNFRLDAAPDEARTAFLVSTWRLYPEIAVLVLVDPDGQELVPPVYGANSDEAGLHDVVSTARLASFREALPVAVAPVTRGGAYIPEGGSGAVLPVSFASPYGDGVVLGAELSLRALGRDMLRVADDQRTTLLLDTRGEVLLAGGRGLPFEPGRLVPLLRSAAADARVGDDYVVATAAVEGRDMVVAVIDPASVVDRAVAGVQEPTLYVGLVALIAALVGGQLLGRTITAPVHQLREATLAVGEGDLSRRVHLPPTDELGELGQSFDHMTERLASSIREIEEKRAIIDRYNRELERLVSERTAQLVETQEQLVQSRQLAAVAEMSAGLAHELNNPLAGVLGLLQLLKQMRAGQAEAGLLGSAEEQALRCKEIVGSLLRFTAHTRNEGEHERVDLAGIVRDVVGLAGSAFRQRGVGLELEAEAGELPILAHPDELGRALSQVLTALRGIAAPGSALSVGVGRVKGEMVARAEVRLTLEAVVDSDDDWRASALGLWAARQVLVSHEARLEEVTVGAGRAWRLVVPLADAPSRGEA